MRIAKWKEYAAKDSDFDRWVRRLARNSKVTASEYARKCLQGCEEIFGTTPATLVERARRDRRAVEDKIDDAISEMEDARKAGGTIHNIVKPIQAWLKFMEVPLQRSFSIRNRTETPTLNGDEGKDRGRAPRPDELREILNAGTPRARVIMSTVAYSGLRPECLGNYDGTDAIRLRDVPALRIVEGGRRILLEAPAKVIVRPPLSKAGHQYFTFLGAEGTGYVVAYLNQRGADGEILGPAAPLVGAESAASKRAGREPGHTIVTKNVTADVKDAIVKAGFSFRPYDLRTYFESRMAIAESQKGVPPRYTEFFAGHKGIISDHYSTHRRRPDPKLEEDMARQYRVAEVYLSAVAPPPPDLDAERAVIEERVRAQVRAELDEKTEELGLQLAASMQDMFELARYVKAAALRGLSAEEREAMEKLLARGPVREVSAARRVIAERAAALEKLVARPRGPNP